MAVREFDGVDDQIIMAPGAMNGTDSGPFTVMIYLKRAQNNTFETPLTGASGSATEQWACYFNDTDPGLAFRLSNGASYLLNSSLGITTTDGWAILGITKADGTTAARIHTRKGGVWSHGDSSGTGADCAAIDNMTIGSEENGDNNFAGRIAVIGLWSSVLSDSTIENAGFESSLADWEAAAPDVLWALNQAATTTDVTDVTGGGADQSAITGTTVVTGDDPPGFDFEGGGGGTEQAWSRAVTIGG